MTGKNQKNSRLLVSGFVLTASVLALILTEHYSRRVPAPAEQKPVAEAADCPTPGAKAPVKESVAELLPSAPSQTEAAPVRPPEKEAVLTEVKQDPHTTPPSLIAFAANLGKRMTGALKSEATATQLFDELERCLSASTTLPSAQAMCLHDAQRLGARFSSLSERYRIFQAKASPEVQNLARFVQAGESDAARN